VSGLVEEPAGETPPVLGPDSLVWQLGGDWTVLLGGGRALLLQVSHPVVAAGVEQYSDFRANPWKRLTGTLDLYLSVVFGGEQRARRAGADLRSLHRDIKGVDADGRRYHALDPEAFAWVHATLVDSAVQMIERFRQPLSPAERERYYAEMGQVGALYGLRAEDLPADWSSFQKYLDEKMRTRLRDSATVRDVLASVMHPARPPVLPVPDRLWRAGSWPGAALARLVTIGTLPQPLRELLGLRWTEGQQRALEAGQRLIRRVGPTLPDRLRLMPPAYEARRRERDRRAAPAPASGSPRRATA
jgi:uncharacterized protein (DUF2236 family)